MPALLPWFLPRAERIGVPEAPVRRPKLRLAIVEEKPRRRRPEPVVVDTPRPIVEIEIVDEPEPAVVNAPVPVVAPPADPTRPPATRGDCAALPRPCTATRCRWHLAVDARGPVAESCALDVADRGGATLEEVAQTLGITRERVRQIEAIALGKVEKRGLQIGMVDVDDLALREPRRGLSPAERRRAGA